jgi:hypothetical protein
LSALLVTDRPLCYVADIDLIQDGGSMKFMSWSARVAALLALTVASAVVAAADLPPLPQGLSAPAKPIKMQAFNLPTAAGGFAKADDYKGKVLIARFWATW